MNNEIKISVLMTAYNVESFIGEAIESVLTQTFTDFEFIIINDGSIDSTEAIIRSYKDPRILFINHETNKGIAVALNSGLKVARSKYIARFDADDICYPRRLEKQYSFISEHPDYVIVGSSADYVDASGEYVFTSFPPAFTNDGIQFVRKKLCPFVHSSVMYKKDLVLQHGGYNEHAYSFEDHFLWLTIIDKGKAYNFREPLIKVRLNPDSITIDEQWRPKEFHQIKNNVIEKNFITEIEGKELYRIIQSQNRKEVKEGAYHSLLAKKYLWNNYQPSKARKNLKKVIGQNRFDWKSYCFYLLSYLPEHMLQKWYRAFKDNNSSFQEPENK